MGMFDYGAGTSQPENLKQMPYRESPWKEHYPQLVGMLEDEPEKPKNNRVAHNICWGGRWDEVSKEARPYLLLEANFLEGDPRFVDAEKQDFRLRTDSPALALGFRPIPIEQIGLQRDEWRASWPVRHAPLPDQSPAQARRKDAPTHVALRVSPGQITVDGQVDDWPRDEARAMRCATPACGQASRYVSSAWAAFDGAALYLLVINPVDSTKPPKADGAWGEVDAIELAFRSPTHAKSLCYGNPIFNLRGFPNGKTTSVVDAGATAEQASQLGAAVAFAATVTADRWVGEWRIPLAAAGIEAATARELPFNLNIRRPADNSWMVWADTDGAIWEVDAAGVIQLGAGR
jgi:hypothetical protein